MTLKMHNKIENIFTKLDVSPQSGNYIYLVISTTKRKWWAKPLQGTHFPTGDMIKGKYAYYYIPQSNYVLDGGQNQKDINWQRRSQNIWYVLYLKPEFITDLCSVQISHVMEHLIKNK